MGVIIVPIIALLIPLSRVLPPLYSWRIRKRVYRWYGQLHDVEHDVDQEPGAADEADGGRGRKSRGTRRARQLARLAEIEKKVGALVVPLSYANELYTLKLHIDRVRDKLVAAGGERAPGADKPTIEPDAQPALT
jgi:uncharacterized protein